MKKIELKVLGLSYSQTQIGSYVLVLSESTGRRKLPIIIKPTEAQVIALKIEGMKSPRPLTHDLFKSFADSFGVDIQEVYIHTIAEGIFYTRLISSNGIDEINIECTAGDGIAMALTFGCPIFVSESVLLASGIIMDDYGTSEDTPYSSTDSASTNINNVVSLEDLEQLMKEAESNEEYEIAAEIRDRIKSLK